MSIDRLKQYLSYLQHDPENEVLLTQSLELAIQNQQHKTTEMLLASAKQQNFTSFKLRYLTALHLVQTENYEVGERLFALLYQESPTELNIVYHYGLCLLQTLQPQKAIDILLPVMTPLKASIPKAQLLLGHCYHHCGKLIEAIEQVKTYCEVKTNSAEALGLLSLLYFDTNDNHSAALFAQKAQQIDPNNHEAKLANALIQLVDFNMDAANNAFKSLLSNNPRSGRSWLGKGMTQLAQKEYPAAEQSLLKATDFMPSHVGTLVALGWCRISLQKLTLAEADFRKAIKLRRSFAECHAGLSITLIMQNKIVEAKKYLQFAKRLAPDAISTLYAEASIDYALNKKQDGLKKAQRIRELPVVTDGPLLKEVMQQFQLPGEKDNLVSEAEIIKKYFNDDGSSASKTAEENPTQSNTIH